MLLCHVLGRERSYLYAWPERELEDELLAAYQALLARRLTGEPVAYLTGHREFWSMTLSVSPATLIPRPETERLVEIALDRLPIGVARDVLDLGTGSGAIALALARERPACRVTAVDASAEALAVARENARQHHLNHVRFLQGSWFGPLAAERFDLVVSNPPYIRAEDPHLGRGDVRFEPAAALAAGADGLEAIRVIVGSAPAYLQPRGWLLLEHGYDQADAVRSLLVEAGFVEVFTKPDWEGRDRISGGRHGP